MATTTRAVGRRILSENIGDHFSSTATSTSDTTSLIDTALISYQFGGDTDAFIDWYIIVTESGHSALGEVRQVKSYDASTGDLTLESALTAAVDSGQAYELHRYDPRHKHVALNRGVEEVNGVLFLPLIDETLVVNDILSNSDFETFSSGFTGWTAVNSPTVTAETTIVFHGTNSAKVISGAGSDGQLTQAPTINVAEMTKKSVELWCFVYATAGSVARIRLDWDGSDIESSDFHSGDDEWQLLKIRASVPDSATQIKVILEVASGTKTAYFDSCRLEIGDKHRYTISTAIEELRYVTQQVDEKDETDFREIQVRPQNLRRLRLEGKGVLTEWTTADSSTVEIGGNQINLLVRYAEVQFWQIISALAADDDKRNYIQMAQAAERRYEILRDRALGQEPMGAQNRRGVWHTERDASGYYLIFDNLARQGIVIGR